MSAPSIKVSGPALFVLPVLILVVAFALLASWQGSRVVGNFTDRIMRQTAERVQVRVNGYLREAVQVTDQNAALIRTGELDPDDLPAWRQTMYAVLSANKAVNSVTFGTPRGESTWVIRYYGEPDLEYAIQTAANGTDEQGLFKTKQYRLQADGELGEPIGQGLPYDPRTRPWYQAALSAGEPTWSPVYSYLRDSGEPTFGIAYTRPVRGADGQLLGVLDSDVSLIDISDFLKEARPSESGEVFLVEPDGNLIATSGESSPVSGRGRVRAREMGDALLARVARQVEDRSGSFSSVGEESQFLVEGDEGDHYVEVTPLENPWGLDWRAVVVVPEADVTGAVNELRVQAGLIGGLIALGALGLGIVASRSLVRPITRLVEAVRRIGRGEFKQKVDVTGHAEFATLSDELNKMSDGLRDRMRMRESLTLAMEIQQKLLPERPPSVAGLDVAGQSSYCDETGGDYYDFLELGETDQNTLFVALGDVMGHGIAAALLMATARGILRSRASEPGTLGELLCHANDLLVQDTEGERFMTMVLLSVDPRSHTVRFASAGHDLPLLYDPQEPQFKELPAVGRVGLPLGVMGGEVYEETEQGGFQPGQVLLVGTDGLWETSSPTGEMFGKARLWEAVHASAGGPAEEVARSVVSAVEQFRGGGHQDDDVTFVIVKFR